MYFSQNSTAFLFHTSCMRRSLLYLQHLADRNLWVKLVLNKNRQIDSMQRRDVQCFGSSLCQLLLIAQSAPVRFYFTMRLIRDYSTALSTKHLFNITAPSTNVSGLINCNSLNLIRTIILYHCRSVVDKSFLFLLINKAFLSLFKFLLYVVSIVRTVCYVSIKAEKNVLFLW